MDRKTAREEIKRILKEQKVVRVSRLQHIWNALGYEALLHQEVGNAKKIQRQTKRLRELERKGMN